MHIDSSPNPPTVISPTTSALNAVVEQMETAIAADDLPRALELLDQNVLEAWFGLGPERLFRALAAIEAHGLQLSAVLTALRGLMLGAVGASEANGDQPAVEPRRGPQSTVPAPVIAAVGNLEHSENISIAKYVGDTGSVFTLRVQGRPVEALHLSKNIRREFGSFQTLFASYGGWGLFNSLQEGITAMLAGDFRLAEAHLAESKLHPAIPTLPFLTRDAHSKSAVLHALFGDPVVARAELDIADQQPRTHSWVEAVIDAQTEIVRAIVAAESLDEAIELLQSIQLGTLGEMWPFYAYALEVVHARANQPGESRRILEILDQTRLPRMDNQGFTGSVLPSLLAFSDLMAGNLVGARELWKRVDSDLVLSRLGDAVFALASGNAQEGTRIAMELRGSTRNLRQMELWRLSILATSLFQQDDEVGCLEVLRTAQGLPRGLSQDDVRMFHAQILELASKHLADWPPVPSEKLSAYSNMSLTPNTPLTPRELDMLAALARGQTRSQIAKELFLSVNTVKAHQQTLYRKLGVTSKNAAVIEGQQRGLI